MSSIFESRVLIAALVLLAPLPVAAGEWSLAGSLASELRWFTTDPLSPQQIEDDQLSLALAPEVRWRSEEGRHRLTISPYYRWDAEDEERSHFDLREGAYRYLGDDWELLVGFDRVFWGVTESRHLVDVINQTDGVEDIDGEDKLGQPMIRLGLDRDWGRLELFALVGFRERTFPGLEGRLRPPLEVDTDASRYESSAEDERIDLALRWSHYIGDWDLGLHVFHGTGRAPALLLSSQATLIPFYSVTSQVGADLQYTKEAWLWKLEALVREGQGRTFGALVVGFEHTFYQLAQTSSDLGVLVEFLWDDRDGTAPQTIYDRDVFIGGRLALNDVANTSLLVGSVIDIDDGSMAVLIESERRLGQHLSLEFEGRLFTNVDRGSDLAAIAEDDVVTLRLAWHL